MTIVGPRPERPEIAEEYEKVMPEFRLRLQARDLIKSEENVICLAKDGGFICKLNIYDKSNKNTVLNIFQNLKVKAYTCLVSTYFSNL